MLRRMRPPALRQAATMTRTITLIASIASIALTLAAGCPEPSRARPNAKCSKAYEQCNLAQGLLGVCDPVECNGNDGQPPPCFICRPQH
jgi:hypothetical protein